MQRHLRALPLVLLPLISLSGCLVAPGTRPGVHIDSFLMTKYIHRGQVEVNDPVVQGNANIDLPTKDGGTLSLGALGNVNLRNKNGGGWFPDGKAGKFTEVDLSASYSRQVAGIDVRGGVETYVLPDGPEFPFGVRGTTTEVFGAIGKDLAGFYPQFTMHYDWDEVDGYYLESSLSRDFKLFEKLTAEASVGLGYSDKDHSDWTYGIAESGLADGRGSVTLFYDYDESTTFQLGVAYSTIIDKDLRDWFDIIDIEPDNFWITFGVGWSF
jgi:hypothetical protein